jgi:hypothetical protein
MRITDIRTIAVEVKLPEPVYDANYTMATKPALLVEVETDQGLVGLGEAAHFGGPMASTAQVIEHELRNYLIGQDPRNIEYLWELMHRRAYKHARGGIVIAAISGIDIALWDLRGKMAGMPLWQLLGGYGKRVLASLPPMAAGVFELLRDKCRVAGGISYKPNLRAPSQDNSWTSRFDVNGNGRNDAAHDSRRCRVFSDFRCALTVAIDPIQFRRPV